MSSTLSRVSFPACYNYTQSKSLARAIYSLCLISSKPRLSDRLWRTKTFHVRHFKSSISSVVSYSADFLLRLAKSWGSIVLCTNLLRTFCWRSVIICFFIIRFFQVTLLSEEIIFFPLKNPLLTYMLPPLFACPNNTSFVFFRTLEMWWLEFFILIVHVKLPLPLCVFRSN